MNIAINGFGRIGKNFLRVLFEDEIALKTIKPTVINIGGGDIEHTAYSFKYDTILETFNGKVSMEKDTLIINDHSIKVIAELDPKKINWAEYNIDWVVEASGQFTTRKKAQYHLDSGAKKILITAPATDEDVTIIPGVNAHVYKDSDSIVSLGSCTTNALAPALKILHNAFSLKQVQFSTIHSYTNAQVLLDVEKKKYRNSRAAALNIIPSTTGASKVIGRVLPELDGIVLGSAIRVPIAKVSLLDIVFSTEKSHNVDDIHKAFIDAIKSELKDIVEITDEPLVSSDYNKNPHSFILDSLLTQVQDDMSKISGWYDNEWAYCERLKDFLLNAK